MDDKDLLELNRKGFFPGPKERESDFLRRVNQKRDEEHRIPDAHLAWARERLDDLYDFYPESLIVYYSNKGLSFWEGAACWIEGDRTRLQLREGFRKGTFLGIYSRDEVLVHEAVHAARVAFDEPINEEFFAYYTGSKQWRRVLGPILRNPREGSIFLISLLLGIAITPVIPCCLMLFGFIRLIRQHSVLRKAAQVLVGRLKSEKGARATLLRFTDSEIKELSQGRIPKGDETLRWRLIRLAYIRDE